MEVASMHTKMPVLFVGHGSPMNAIANNDYRKAWVALGEKLVRPKAILCISAHWLTKGTAVTLLPNPKTIHDFGGFPQELFAQQYPAPGAVAFAQMTIDNVHSIAIQADYSWGFDHGCWTVLMNMYPNADIPVYQMSIDYTKPPQYHYNLAKELAFLRNRGVMIVASGNVVHNLHMVRWDTDAQPFDWAIAFDEMVKKSIVENNPLPLLTYESLGQVARLAHPTNDHFLPLLYAVALRDDGDEFTFFNDRIDLGSMSMRSVVFTQP